MGSDISDKHGNGCTCTGSCMHGMHPMWSPHRFMLLRLILGLIILGMVFMIGMKIGEFKGMYGSENFGGYEGDNYHHMQQSRGYNHGYYQDDMMAPQTVPTQIVPSVTPTRTITNTAR